MVVAPLGSVYSCQHDECKISWVLRCVDRFCHPGGFSGDGVCCAVDILSSLVHIWKVICRSHCVLKM